MNAKGPSADRLRHLIDSGKTGDKIPALDPAAAPLGTDDEAAGTPPDARAVQHAIDQETGRGLSGNSGGRAARTRRSGPLMSPWAIVALIVAVCAAAVAVVMI